MRRDQLEHAIRAATRIVKQREIIIIGSQAILGSWDESELPAEAVTSVEVDMCPIEDDDVESLATEIDPQWARCLCSTRHRASTSRVWDGGPQSCPSAGSLGSFR